MIVNRYHSLTNTQLREKWEEKRRRIADAPKDEVSPRDIDELLSLRREIDKREGDTAPVVNVDYASEYLTD